MHTGKTLCNALVATCDRFELLPKILGITTDNAANINKLLVCFGRVCRSRGITFEKSEQHMKCMAHIMNLAVQALLRELRVETPDADLSLDDNDSDSDDSDDDDDDADLSLGDHDSATLSEQLSCIAKLRRIVVKLHSSTQHRSAFKRQCLACEHPVKELILDVPTRWNSTHAMIERACELREPLSELIRAQHDLLELSDKEWELLEITAQLLVAFDIATHRLSADSYPTLNQAVPIYNYLFNKLEDLHGLCGDESDCQEDAAIFAQCNPACKRIFRNAIQAAHDKIHDYYEQTWAGMYAIAVILDPRFKIDYCEVNKWGPWLTAHAKNALVRAVEAYGAAAPPSDHTVVAAQWDPVNQELYQSLKRRRLEKGGEMERYLAAPTADTDVDVLEWWKHNAREYPCLARIARDYLAIPATSVPAERVFSGGADLITKKRGSLNEDTIQACMCLKSWL
jgi:hAT family C-terminal dimerisation region/Domain of unknown function (DUF4413)